MKKTFKIVTVIAGFVCLFYACKKNTSSETTTQSVPPLQIGQAITGTTLGTAGGSPASVKGTMLANTTYNVVGDIQVPKGDTLYLQSGVTVCVAVNANIAVYGVIISMGTQANPNVFTCCQSGATKINTIAQAESPTTDPAWNGVSAGTAEGWWTGISCDTSCTLCCLKWTNVEFYGAKFATTYAFVGGTAGSISYGVLFQNTNGDLIVEDSWFYGGYDDCIRIQTGRLSIMRCTFEKNGGTSGDVLNAKSGSVGDMAYNLFMGTCTNGTKASNKGGNAIECNINMYNNTYVDGGYRQSGWAGRSGSIDYEQGAEGKAYNNLMVNCRTGARVCLSPVADTINCFMGNNYAYGDSASVLDEVFPVGHVTKPGAYVFPTAAECNYVFNNSVGAAAYNASAEVGQGNPKFKNFPLPEAGIVHLYDINWGGAPNAWDFHLTAGSPCIGAGNITAISPLAATRVTKAPFAAIITAPGADIGCYQSNGTGNQH